MPSSFKQILCNKFSKPSMPDKYSIWNTDMISIVISGLELIKDFIQSLSENVQKVMGSPLKQFMDTTTFKTL